MYFRRSCAPQEMVLIDIWGKGKRRMEPKIVTQEEYEKIRADMEKEYHYDEMSDEEREQFDSAVDRRMIIGDRPEENSDETDNHDNKETKSFRDEMKKEFNYDEMSDEQKEEFEKKLDEVLNMDNDETENVEPEIGSKMKKL